MDKKPDKPTVGEYLQDGRITLREIMKCTACGEEFEATRSTAKYCSDKCRKLAFLSVPKVSVPDVTEETPCKVPVKAEVVTLQSLGLSEKLLGITSWTENGILISPDISVAQVRDLAMLIHAKYGRSPTFYEVR